MRHLPAYLCAVVLLAGAAFPTPRGFVNDFASVLDAGVRARLEARLSTYERETGNEIAIAIFPSLQGQTIETMAVKLFEEWKIGKRGHDNGILILVAVQDRAVRIEVGYGLEGRVPDGLAGRIIREAIVPNFRAGRYAEGLEAAVDELIRAIASPVEPRRSSEPVARPGLHPTIPLALAVAVLVIVAIAYSYRSRPRCPKCGRIMYVASRRRIRTVHGLREALLYQCPLGHYSELREGPLWQPGGWGTVGPWVSGGGGFSSGSGSSGGFGGFGGGSSGGGGASGQW